MTGQSSPAAGSACHLASASPLAVPITGTLAGIVIDDACQNVYLTNHTLNRVEHFSLQDLALKPPIQVGSMPVGLDLRPGTTLLYVANTGGNNMSVVDVAQRREVRRIIMPTERFNTDRPYSVAIANNGLALVSTTYGNTTGGRLMQLHLDSDVMVARGDAGFATEDTRLRASGSRNAIAVAIGNRWPGSVLRYDAASNAFSPAKRLDTDILEMTTDFTGSVLFVTWQNLVLDAALNTRGTIPPAGLGSGVVSPDGRFAYRSRPSGIDVLDLQTRTRTGGLAIGDTVTPVFPDFIGQMAISADGRLLAVITDNGLTLVATGM